MENKTLLSLSSRELSTVLAALRYWQSAQSAGENLLPYLDIATNGDSVSELSADEIDVLCEQLNFGAGDTPEPGKAMPILDIVIYEGMLSEIGDHTGLLQGRAVRVIDRDTDGTAESHLDILETIGGKSEKVFRRIEEVGPISYKGETED